MPASLHAEHFRLVNSDCLVAASELGDGCADLVLTDPPYGIDGDRLHRHYNRNEDFVTPGYVEVPRERYNAFSRAWVAQAERILRPGGQLYVVSGYSNLYDVLDALRATDLREINHLIWKYNFGVFTRTKFVSSHYHILYYAKPGGDRTFNVESRFALDGEPTEGGSANYRDREDVWTINREYQPGREKNKNQLPRALLVKILQYASRPGDHVVDFFAGSGSTGVTALELGRTFTGFEISPAAFAHASRALEKVAFGSALRDMAPPQLTRVQNRGKRWSDEDRARVVQRYRELTGGGHSQKAAVQSLAKEFGRGAWSIRKVLSAEVRHP